MFTKQNSINGNFVWRRIFIPAVLSLFFISSVSAQAVSGVDLTFNTAVARNQIPNVSTSFGKTTVQPDGKILLYGNFNNLNEKSINKITRLNTDGSVDNSFNCTGCENFYSIFSALVQPDGKILLSVSAYGNNPIIVRLNADGSLDTSFNFPLFQRTYSGTVWGIQPDGKILVSTDYSWSLQYTVTLRRANSDGSIDQSFTPTNFFGSVTNPARDNLHNVIILPDGKIMYSSRASSNCINRLNSDGTIDNTFERPVFSTGTFGSPVVYDFGIQSNGQIVMVGDWATVNGINQPNFARLNPGGNVDINFAGTGQGGTSLEILSNNKILIDGTVRRNADGTLDNTYNAAYPVSYWTLDSLERVVFTGPIDEFGEINQRVGRMNTDGSADNSFSPSVFGVNGDVTALAVQPDGKILIGGFYNRVNGVRRVGFARVNTNGTLDTTFNAGISVNQGVNAGTVVVQPDGKILVGTTRLKSDGELDIAFNPVVDAPVFAVALQPDGKILIGGAFTNVNGVNRTGVARLNADGTLDTTFNPLFGSPTIYSLLVQADGKIMVGGTFTGVSGFNRTNLVRLNADGSVDTAFNTTIGTVSQIARTSDGKYFVISNSNIVKRNADGTVDAGFQTPTLGTTTSSYTFIQRFVVQPDGNVVIVGEFGKVNNINRNNLARLRPNGEVDVLFFPRGSNGRINDIAAQADGKLIAGGNFSTFEGIARSAVARLTSATFRQATLFDYDGDGKADISVFRPSENKWYVLRSSDFGVTQQIFAISGDAPVPADYDGDGKTDFAIFRPSAGDWWSLYSTNNAQTYAHWGQNGVIPRPSDFDGDGKDDYIYFDTTNSNWYRFGSSTGVSNKTFGLAGDKPITGDFDGDGKTDVAIYRPSTGDWWWQSSIDNVQRATHWGISTDIPAPADYDGDNKTDFAVYRPSTGTWYIYNSATLTSTILNFGLAEDKPVPADYDGDGKADIAVFRPSTGTWYLMKSTEGFTALQFGISTDIPTENAFVP